MTITQNSQGAVTPRQLTRVSEIDYEPISRTITKGLPRGYRIKIGNTAKMFTYPDRSIRYAKHYRTMWTDRIGDECVEFRYDVYRNGFNMGYGYIRYHYVAMRNHPDSIEYGNTLARFYYGFPFSMESQSGTMLEYCSDGFNDSPNADKLNDTRLVCYDLPLSDEDVKTLRTWKDVRKVLEAMDETLRPYSEQYLRGYRRIGSPWYDELTD